MSAAVLSGWLARSKWPAILGYLRREWPTVLVTELVFLAFFALWLAVAAHAPAINHTEKPMDFGFLNAVLYSNTFPPEDPWLAGHSVSYYYFGHLMMAFLVKLTGVASPIGYNLAVATIPALLAAGTFTLVSALARLSGGSRTHGYIFGVIAPVLLILTGRPGRRAGAHPLPRMGQRRLLAMGRNQGSGRRPRPRLFLFPRPVLVVVAGHPGHRHPVQPASAWTTPSPSSLSFPSCWETSTLT